jgi:hypothetical protein
MAFTANIAGNVAVAGNLVGNGWLSATAGYNATTGLYTGTTYTTTVSTVGTVSGEWIQIQGNTATALAGFQLVATNDSTGAHNDRLPMAFTIVGSTEPIGFAPPIIYVAGGHASAGTSINNSSLAYSYNGFNWTAGVGTIPDAALFCATNGTIWLSSGYFAGMCYSYNGINWSKTATNIFTSYGEQCGAFYGNGVWVAVSNAAPNYLAYSYEGVTWTGLGTSNFQSRLCVKYNGSIWVAGGYAVFYYSYNGINWTTATSTTANPITNACAVSYSSTMWVIIGGCRSDGSIAGQTINGYNSIAYSYNGILWSSVPKTGNYILGDFRSSFSSSGGFVANNEKMWLAGGLSTQYAGNYIMVYSYNGINWTNTWGAAFSNISSLVNTSKLTGLIWNGTMWLIGAATSSAGVGTILYSYDGFYWSAVAQSTTMFQNNNGIYLASNINYLVRSATPILTGTFTSNPYNPTTNAITGNAAATDIYTIPTTIVTNATQGALTYSTYGNSTNKYLTYRMIVTKIAGNTYGVPLASVSGNVGGFWLPTFQNTIPGITTLNQNSYTPIVVNTSASTTQGSITLSTKVPVYSASVTGNQLVSNVLTGTIYNAGNTTYNYSLTYSPLVIANSITGYTTNAVQLAMDSAASNQLNLTGNLNVTGTVYPTSMSESFTTITTSTSPLTLNFGNGATFYLTSPPSANFTCNITNVPSAIGRTYLCTLIITASATKTFCNSVQINGNTAITPYFANGIPTSITTGSFITQTIAIQRILAGDVNGSVNVLSTITTWY